MKKKKRIRVAVDGPKMFMKPGLEPGEYEAELEPVIETTCEDVTSEPEARSRFLCDENSR